MKELTVDIAQKRFAPVGSAPPVVALKDLRFSARPGEFVCVLGPSGCGKTTLLNIIAGLDDDFTGHVDGGGNSDHDSPTVGYVFQTPRLLPWRTVAENIRLVLRPRQNASVVDELLALTGLSAFRDAYPERLSVGMSRRVALARAFAVEPDLLLMDEPFVSLDEETAEKLRQLLLDIWRRRPTTVLFVTHDKREAVLLADRIVRLTASPGTVDRFIAVDIPREQRGDSGIIESWRALYLRDS
jgi:NitT/TauT family transport system ATP-binding protein